MGKKSLSVRNLEKIIGTNMRNGENWKANFMGMITFQSIILYDVIFVYFLFKVSVNSF